MTTYLGKVRVLDELMWLRSGENHPVQFTGWNRKLEFHDWYRDENFQREVDDYFRTMSEALASTCSSWDGQAIKVEVRAATEVYVRRCDSPGVVSAVRHLWNSLSHAVALRLPNELKYRIRNRLGLVPGQVDMRDLPTYFEQKGIGVNAQELARVIETLQAFYGAR